MSKRPSLPSVEASLPYALYGIHLSHSIEEPTLENNPLSESIKSTANSKNLSVITHAIQNYEVVHFQDNPSLHFVILHVVLRSTLTHFICYRGNAADMEQWINTFKIRGKMGNKGFIGAATARFERLVGSRINFSYFQDLLEKGEPVIFCGHSLGGALATIITRLFLRQLPIPLIEQHPPLMCLSFGTPLSLDIGVEWNLQKDWEIYFHHVIHIDDPIPVALSSLNNNEFVKTNIFDYLLGKITTHAQVIENYRKESPNFQVPKYHPYGTHYIYSETDRQKYEHLPLDFFQKVNQNKAPNVTLVAHSLSAYIHTIYRETKEQSDTDTRALIPRVDKYVGFISITGLRLFQNIQKVEKEWLSGNSEKAKADHTVLLELRGKNLDQLQAQELTSSHATLNSARPLQRMKILQRKFHFAQIVATFDPSINLDDCFFHYKANSPPIALRDFEIFTHHTSITQQLYQNADLLKLLTASLTQCLFLHSITGEWNPAFNELLELEKQIIYRKETGTDVLIAKMLPLIKPEALTENVLRKISLRLQERAAIEGEVLQKTLMEEFNIREKPLELISFTKVKELIKTESITRCVYFAKPTIFLLYLRLTLDYQEMANLGLKLGFALTVPSMPFMSRISDEDAPIWLKSLCAPLAVATAPALFLGYGTMQAFGAKLHTHSSQNYRQLLKHILEPKNRMTDFEMEEKLLNNHNWDKKHKKLKNSISPIHHLRKFCMSYFIFGVLGDSKCGKSTFLQRAFQCNSKASDVHATIDATPFLLFPSRNIIVVDFPGTDDIRTSHSLAILPCLSGILMVQDFGRPISPNLEVISTMAEGFGIPVLHLLNKFDQWLCQNSGQKKPTTRLNEATIRYQNEFQSYFFQHRSVYFMMSDLLGYSPAFTQLKDKYIQKHPDFHSFCSIPDIINWIFPLISEFEQHDATIVEKQLPLLTLETLLNLQLKSDHNPAADDDELI